MLLEGVRVVDATVDIAGPYCTKLLADAGADVVKAEPPDGDPTRRRGRGALFEYLNAGKRSVTTAAADLAPCADVLVTADVNAYDPATATRDGLVLVTVTPFGADGPWVGRPATEFTLQAASGSTATRGLSSRPPVAAGGRLGEWLGARTPPLGAVAALRRREADGRGAHVDVALLDVMAVTMVPFPSVFAEFMGWPEPTAISRAVEVPSIEPTADGFVAFTTNSPDQFAAFCTLVGRPDLAAEPTLASPARRSARRDWFLAEVVHPYTTARTTAALLDEAAQLRIPAAPVLDGSTVPDFPHFAARGAFVDAASGRFVQPRCAVHNRRPVAAASATCPRARSRQRGGGLGRPHPAPRSRGSAARCRSPAFGSSTARRGGPDPRRSTPSPPSGPTSSRSKRPGGRTSCGTRARSHRRSTGGGSGARSSTPSTRTSAPSRSTSPTSGESTRSHASCARPTYSSRTSRPGSSRSSGSTGRTSTS